MPGAKGHVPPLQDQESEWRVRARQGHPVEGTICGELRGCQFVLQCQVLDQGPARIHIPICVHLEVHRYLEEDHIPRQLVTSRAIEVEDELVSSKVAGLGKQPKFLSDLISGQNILAEEMKK